MFGMRFRDILQLSQGKSMYRDDTMNESKIERLNQAIEQADAVVIGAGAGLSNSAGLYYSGERFERHFPDFISKYGFTDMYSASFFPYPTQEEFWAFWSRCIYFERYCPPPKPVYTDLFALVKGKDYFVITTNVDHVFQRSGFDKQRLFYTQGDYGLWQCKKPCHQKTYDNEETVKKMFEQQSNMKVPPELVPKCPECGGIMYPNLRGGNWFVQDEGWYEAEKRYSAFVRKHEESKAIYLDLGTGGNTPVIIKYPFMQMTKKNPNATYVCINFGEAMAPTDMKDRSICINADIGQVVTALLEA